MAIRKRLTAKDREFARLLEEAGLGAIEAARKAYKWRCESPKDYDYQAALNLAKSPAILEERERIRERLIRLEEAKSIVSGASLDPTKLRDFALKRLVEIRDDPDTKSSIRLQAIKALERLHDPSRDANLIWRWIDVAWRGLKVHCPCCHKSFPLAKIENPKLQRFREHLNLDPKIPVYEDDLERRLALLRCADSRNEPHPGQKQALGAPERHIVGTAAARSGKSYLLAMFAFMGILVPGVEIWILARIYEDARSESEYLKKFLNTAFHPFAHLLIKEVYDRKSGELILTTHWGSELRIRSTKSKGSITGRELELALVAEPGWVDESIYEELRARMSSRLGRIIALGTPKGVAGFIGRMVNTVGRDPKSGKVIRLTPEDRLIANGASWNISCLIYSLNPADNPAYVKSELEAARMELTDAEYDSEFRGLMVAEDGAKFPQIKQQHLITVDGSYFSNAVFVLGVDQGPVNFAAVLVAWDGEVMVPCWEYFDSSDWTMRKNLIELRNRVPVWIRLLGGDFNKWIGTCVDRDPPIWNILDEIALEGLEWPTQLTLRHQNNRKAAENWRRMNQEMINNLARKDRLLFHLSEAASMDTKESPGAAILHQQMINTLDVPEKEDRESRADNTKGWLVNDPWRGDHVLDAFYFASWGILGGALMIPSDLFASRKEMAFNPWSEAYKAFQYRLKASEALDFGSNSTFSRKPTSRIFEESFGRKRNGMRSFRSHPILYLDES